MAWLDDFFEELKAAAPHVNEHSLEERSSRLEEVLAYARSRGFLPSGFKQVPAYGGDRGMLALLNPNLRTGRGSRTIRHAITPYWTPGNQTGYGIIKIHLHHFPALYPDGIEFRYLPWEPETKGSPFYIQPKDKLLPTSLKEIDSNGLRYTLTEQNVCIEEVLKAVENEGFTRQRGIVQTYFHGDNAHMCIYPEQGILSAVIDSVYDHKTKRVIFRLHIPPDNIDGSIAFFDPKLSPRHNKSENTRRERYCA